jgi:DNA-binding NarL/FixJ family response regulator
MGEDRENLVPELLPDRPSLTTRERAVLQQAAYGLSNRAIGEQLGIAEQTVKNHLASAMRKLEIHDRTHVVVVAIARGLIGIPVAEGSGIGEDVSGHVLVKAAEQRSDV